MEYHESFINSGLAMGLPKDVLELVVSKSAEHWSRSAAIPPPDQRLTFGVGVEGKSPVLSMQVEKEKGSAMLLADSLKKELDYVKVSILPNAVAQSAYPKKASIFARDEKDEFVPGVSVGSRKFPCGSLGCIVRSGDALQGLTAAHVLDLNQSVEDRAWVHSPGKPDVNNHQRKFRVGRLNNSIDLEPMSQSMKDSDGELIVATLDVATFDLELPEDSGRGFSNCVPVSGNKRISLQKAGDRDAILTAALNREIVYKRGRTTGVTQGTVFETNMLDKHILLPNNKLYLYANLFSVQSGRSNETFSDRGDSGAPVYTDQGVLLGFVVAVMGELTLCCCAAEAMKELGVELYTA